MVGDTYMWVKDQKVIIILSIFTVKASNEDEALLMDIRKKDLINTIITTFMMLEPLDRRPVTSGFGFKQFAERVSCLRKESAVRRKSPLAAEIVIVQCGLSNRSSRMSFSLCEQNYSLCKKSYSLSQKSFAD